MPTMGEIWSLATAKLPEKEEVERPTRPRVIFGREYKKSTDLHSLFQNPEEREKEIKRHRMFLRRRMKAVSSGLSYPKTRKALEEPEELSSRRIL